MMDILTWIEEAGISMKAKNAVKAFAAIDIHTTEDLIEFLTKDENLEARPKGVGKDNYQILVDKAFAEKNQEKIFVGLTSTTGKSFSAYLNKQAYEEFRGVIDALEIWVDAHKNN